MHNVGFLTHQFYCMYMRYWITGRNSDWLNL